MKKNIFQICMAIVGVWFILSLAVTAVLNFRQLYYKDITKLFIEEQSGYSEEEIKQNYDVLIDYNLIGGPQKLKFPTLPMSNTAEIHFEEVKHILLFFQYGLLITIPILIFGLIQSIRWKDWGWMKKTDIILILLVVLAGGYMAIDWDGFFVFFHKLMFRNDYWFFDYRTDPIILMLPDTFFLHFAIALIVLVIIQMIVFWVGAICIEKRVLKKKK